MTQKPKKYFHNSKKVLSFGKDLGKAFKIMLVRIVKMSFEPSKIEEFLANFEANKDKIRAFKGCNFLELYRDQNNTNIFFTYSYWNSEDDLNNYRHSDLFNGVWTKTKPLFNAKPEAWSVDKIASLK